MSDLIDRTRAWIDGDPDAATRAELTGLIERDELDELAERMGGTLAFGTAGLRGAVEAGSNRMNRAVVIRTTAGLAAYLIERYDGVPDGPVVVGRDARLSSPQFLDDTLAVLAAAGLEVVYWAGDTPTPLVAYSALQLGACAAIVITASHNPPQDNGYKVYDANGAQIVPPVDRDIASQIDAIGPANAVPLVDDPRAHDRVTQIDREMYERYLSTIAAGRVIDRYVPQRIVYTPMHGVGWQSVRAALHAAGHSDLHPVPEQVEPDGTFPTVAFPNPEEPGALDLSTELATRIGADLILANDPDADRLAVAIPFDDRWRSLTGNQIGLVLADHLLERYSGPKTPLVINSIVSSPMLRSIADGHGARFETTLTGFKWIANAAMDLEASDDLAFVFGFEEALGYTVGPTVRDKDGVSAALAFADMTAEAAADGQSVRDLLADLYRRFGYWSSVQHSIVRPGSSGLAEIRGAMERLAEATPTVLGGERVLEVADYRQRAELRPRWLATTALVEFSMEEGGRVLVRPSGTEPKLKIYVDGRADVPDGYDPFGLEPELAERAERQIADLVAFLELF